MRREIPQTITFIAGLVYVLAFYFTVPAAVTVQTTLDKWFLITTAFSCLLGVANLTRIHSKSVQMKKPNWVRSAILIFAMYGTLAIGVIGGHNGPVLKYVYNNMIVPLDGTMYAILVFYIGSASYRAFRARNLEAVCLLVAGIIVMLGQAPIGATISKYIPIASSWILDVPNTAGMRGIILGASLGAVAQAFRVLVGIERQHLGMN